MARKIPSNKQTEKAMPADIRRKHNEVEHSGDQSTLFSSIKIASDSIEVEWNIFFSQLNDVFASSELNSLTSTSAFI